MRCAIPELNPYANHARVYTTFYELTLNSSDTANFILARSGAMIGQRALFVGGMFGVAAALSEAGLSLTIVDYTDEMVEVGKARVPKADILKADLRELPFRAEFDRVFVIGRVFTHMISDDDISRALKACCDALRPGGMLMVDNYEDTRIQVTPYFNGLLKSCEGLTQIIRESSTHLVKSTPRIVRIEATYSGQLEGVPFSFHDSIDHRAFSRPEFAELLSGHGFRLVSQGDNFDETSFFTVGEKI